MAVARITGRHHAVEHVHAARHALDQVLRPAHAHQVTRAVARQLRIQVVEHGIALVLRLAHGQAADGVAVEADRLQGVGRAAAQVGVHAPDDAEQGRVVAQLVMRVAAALGPAQAQLHGTAGNVFGGRIRGALVEDHHDVRIEHLLDLHALLGTEEHPGAVGGRGKGHALLGDLASMGQREHLETTGVGQDRSIPAAEAVQPAVVGDDVQAGAQVQVEGVAEDDLGAQRPHLVRQDALDRAIGPHRHEGRRFHRATREGQAATAGTAIAGLELELQSGHGAVIRANSCSLSPKTGSTAHSGLNGTAVEPRHAWLSWSPGTCKCAPTVRTHHKQAEVSPYPPAGTAALRRRS